MNIGNFTLKILFFDGKFITFLHLDHWHDRVMPASGSNSRSWNTVNVVCTTPKST